MALCNITAKNDKQKEVVRALCDRNIDLIIIDGALGSGKTLLATAYALDQFSRNRIDKIVISRPMINDLDENIGFLPGTEQEKLDPYLTGFNCSVEFINSVDYGAKDTWMQGLGSGQIEGKSLATIKGASYNNAILMLDEAQDATLSQIKKFIGRASSHSKVIIMGDNKQKSREKFVGFEALIDKVIYGDYDFIKYVKLNIVERSRIADFADKLGS
jgi:PhoH-like ATPase